MASVGTPSLAVPDGKAVEVGAAGAAKLFRHCRDADRRHGGSHREADSLGVRDGKAAGVGAAMAAIRMASRPQGGQPLRADGRQRQALASKRHERILIEGDDRA